MWFKKTELRKKIDEYGKDTEYLLEFARLVKKGRLEEISLEDIKSYYTSLVEPQNSLHMRQTMMKAVRKFFREYRGENILQADLISDDPLKIVENIARIEPMKKITEKKRGPGRPRDIANIKKAVIMRKEGIPYRRIALALGKDPSQIVVWIRDAEYLLS